MSVVGFDVGNLISIVAIARRRGIDICANEVSKRETPTLVAFSQKERLMGEAAATQQQSNLRNTISGFKRVLGRKFNDPEVQNELKGQSVETFEGRDGNVTYKVDAQGSERAFSAEQIAAMMLKKLRSIAEAEAGQRIVDAVVSVPTWFTDGQRRAMHDAASIAGLNPLAIVTDISACAISWGMPKLDLPEDESAPLRVVFVDMGHSNTSLSAVAFTKKKMTVLATACDRNLGGRNIDAILIDHFVVQANEKLKVDIRSRPKSMLRLAAAVNKLKHVLSSNSQAVSTVECLYDDYDFTLRMDRDEFDTLIEPVLARLAAPCEELLRSTNLTPDQLHAVEVVGGSSRVLAVKTRLSQIFGKELSFTLNTSESIARGCALLGAVLSPAFMVREFEIHDVCLHPINISWRSDSTTVSDMDVDGRETTQQLFTVNNPVPSIKQLTFPRSDALELEATYAQPHLLPGGIPPHIGKFRLADIPKPSREGAKCRLKLKVRLNWFGVIAVDSAQFIEDLPEEAPATPPPADGTAQPDAAAAAAAAEKPAEKKTTVKVVRTDVPVQSTTSGRSKSDLQMLVEEERVLQLRDDEVRSTADSKNAVESYVYEMRDKLEGSWGAFIAPADKEAFRKLMTETEDWLYGDGEDTTRDVYVKKLGELKEYGTPVERRYHEDEGREAAVKALQGAITFNRAWATSLDEKYSHIEEAERAKVTEECASAERWLQDMQAKQSALPKHSNPVLLVADITSKRDALDAAAKKVMNKPKPAPPKVETPAPAQPAAGDAKPEQEAEQKPAPEQPKQEGATQMDMD